jgi:hypothetical protein
VIRLKDSQEALCGRCADDAEVVPPQAEVATGFTPERIAAKGIIAGSTRSLRGSADDAVSGGNADDAEVVPPEVILDSDISRHDIEVCGIDKSRGSALRQSCIY